jgi:mannose-6-phosphate isomerase-like protein (cupin superfamily)
MATEAEIKPFICSFGDGSPPRSEWAHAGHLVLALWYIRRHGRDGATRLIRYGIRRFNERQGKPTGYHETITLAWVAVIDRFLGGRDRGVPVSVLAGELLAECGERDYDPPGTGHRPASSSDSGGRRPSGPGRDESIGTESGGRAVDRVNIREKLALFGDHWHPRVVGELNGQHVKLVKLLGEFVWHKHDHEDELFLVVHGRFCMDFRDRKVWLEEGEFLVVPRGVEHRPVADVEAHVLLFEPATTLNTGDVRDDRTVDVPERI